MSSFTKPLTVTKLKTGMWEVDREFWYYIGEEGSDEFVIIPRGFHTDFASVPRAFWMIIPPDGKYSQAAVLHDYLYSCHGILPEVTYQRKTCDKIFIEAMAVLEVPTWKRRVMYRAVRMFAWLGWKKHARRISLTDQKKEL